MFKLFQAFLLTNCLYCLADVVIGNHTDEGSEENIQPGDFFPSASLRSSPGATFVPTSSANLGK
jgi:hypothetical protein